MRETAQRLRTVRVSGGYTDELVVDLTDTDGLSLTGAALSMCLVVEGGAPPAAADPAWLPAGSGSVARYAFNGSQPTGDFTPWLKVAAGTSLLLLPILDDDGRLEHVRVL